MCSRYCFKIRNELFHVLNIVKSLMVGGFSLMVEKGEGYTYEVLLAQEFMSSSTFFEDGVDVQQLEVQVLLAF